MLREVKTLNKLYRIVIVGVSPSILRTTIKIILKHHIYVADALQIASAIKTKASTFVTGDKDLVNIAKAEGLNSMYVG